MPLLLLALACAPDNIEPDDATTTIPDDTAVPFVDDDGDGWTPGDGDCDDEDAAVNPGASETCNEVDDDCDGSTDEDLATTWYTAAPSLRSA